METFSLWPLFLTSLPCTPLSPTPGYKSQVRAQQALEQPWNALAQVISKQFMT